MFSKTFGYALRSATFVAMHGRDGNKVSLTDLSQGLDIPHHFLGKIMQDLVKHGILGSIKGPNGGFFALDNTLDTRLTDILRITDGSLVFNHCVLNMKNCNADHPCPMHTEFAICRDGMLKSMSEKTLGSLADSVHAEEAYLVR
jgi:Rrf2 family protein